MDRRSVEAPTKTYRSTFFDSARWDRFERRAGDIVVATPYKSGTTWMQYIALNLVHQDGALRNITDFAPWLDNRFNDFEEVQAAFAAQDHRRVIKTHLPADCVPFDPDVRYIFVGRDPRDIFMSLWNHYLNLKDFHFEPQAEADIPALPPPPDDVLTFWDGWISRGAVAGESDGYPFWSCFRQPRTWWDRRDRENVLFVHFNHLKADLRGEIARVAAFFGIGIAPEVLDMVTEMCTFEAMKRDAPVIEASAEETLKGGAKAFINKGTNGRWHDVLTPDRLADYERVALAAMGPDCKAWMETGAAPG